MAATTEAIKPHRLRLCRTSKTLWNAHKSLVVCVLQTLLPRSSSAEWVAAPTKAIKLIDYEYSGMNAIAYDIANHWCAVFAALSDKVLALHLDALFSQMPSRTRLSITGG